MILGYVYISGLIIGCAIGVYLIIKDLSNKIKKQNKYSICFKDNFNITKLPIIKATIFGEDVYMLLDSGASDNCISRSFCDKHKDLLKNTGKTSTITGHEVVVDSYETYININISGVLEQECSFDVINLNTFEQLNNAYGVNIVGILSGQFFNKNKWSLDFDELVVWVKK